MMPRAMKTVDAQFKRFQRGTTLVTNLEAILVIFQQKKIWFFSYPDPKNLPETKQKSSIVISLAEFSRQSYIDSVAWLLVITLIQVYDEKEQKEIKKYTI